MMKLPFVSRKKYEELERERDEITHKLECLLCHATGNRYSKSTYSLNFMCCMVNDHVNDLIEEAIADTQQR